MITVLIAEDHILVRDGIKLLFKDQEDIKIVAEAGNGQEVKKILESQNVDLAILDIDMPILDGIETAKFIRTQHPEIKVLMLSMHDNESFVNKSFQAGAMGYILKNTSKEEFINGVLTVAQGNPYVSHKISAGLFKGGKPAPSPVSNKPEVNLSPREIEILGLISEGLTNGEIADKTFTSKRTIETHRKNLLEKTGAKNTAALIKFALVNEIIKAE